MLCTLSVKNFRAGLSAVAIAFVLAVIFATHASAMPSFARQTGQECAACHNGFPELTPYGRMFKMNGYTFTSGTSELPAVSVSVVTSFTRTNAGQPGGAAPGFGINNNLILEAVDLLYGGRIAPNVGVLAQATYDGIGKRFAWDDLDLRYANFTTLLESELIYGVSLNNTPTVTDPWNSTPSWSYPYLASGLAPTPAAGPLIAGGLDGQVLGTNAYIFWDRLIYAEAGLYKTISPRTQTTLGVDPTGSNSIKGVAPYWRLAVEPTWGHNSLELGVFGLAANLVPGRVSGFGTDHIVDVGFDTQYQYMADRDTASVQASWINESQRLTASQAQGITSNGRDVLHSLNAKVSYLRDQTYGATLGYFRIDGTQDALVYGDASTNNSPNSSGFIWELNYFPFSHGGPEFWPWMNMRVGLQYTMYQKFNGASTNFDGAGTSASDANTLYLYTWVSF